MKTPPVDFAKDLISKLEQIDHFLQSKKYKEALAEIRDFESSRHLDKIPSHELSQFYYYKVCVLHFLGNYNEALEIGEKVFSSIQNKGEDSKIAHLQHVLGLIHLSLGNLENAESEIRDALTGFRRISNFKGIINTLSKLAFIEAMKGNYQRSVKFLSDALEYCNQTDQIVHKAILYGNLGDRFLMMGKWNEAEENLLRNIELNEKANDEVNLCRGLLSLGYIYFLKREFKLSSETYTKSFALVEKNNCVRELAIYHEFFGELEFTQGNHEIARKHYLEAIAIGEKIAPDGDIISQTYRLLAEVQIAEKQYDEALSSCEKALKVAESLGERIEIGAIHPGIGADLYH